MGGKTKQRERESEEVEREEEAKERREREKKTHKKNLHLDHHLCSRLGRRVRVGRLQRARLVAPLLPSHRALAVDLVRRDGDEALDAAVDPAGLEQDVRAVRVVEGESQRVAERVVDVRLRREVHHGVDLLVLEDEVEEVGGLDVALDKLFGGGSWKRKRREQELS